MDLGGRLKEGTGGRGWGCIMRFVMSSPYQTLGWSKGQDGPVMWQNMEG